MKFDEVPYLGKITDGEGIYKVTGITPAHINDVLYPGCQHARYVLVTGNGYIWRRLFDEDLEAFKIVRDEDNE